MDWNDPMEPYEPEYSKSRIRWILIAIGIIIALVVAVFYFIDERNEGRRRMMNISNENIECAFSSYVLTDAYLESVEEWKKRYPDTRYKQAEHAKAAVFFYYPNIPNLNSIEYIRLKGPGNYRIDFNVNTPYNRVNLNGYVEDGRVLWLQAYDVSGFLKEGKYVFEIKYKSGKTFNESKYFRPNRELLNRYKASKRTYSPVGEIRGEELGNPFALKWSIISGLPAFYCVRLAKFYEGMSFARSGDLIYFDNIFFSEPGVSGLNKSYVNIHLHLDRDTLYTWFVEIVDSNEFPKVNMVIYQKFQYFRIK